MKRQSSLSSTSGGGSRKQNSIGCMSAIASLLSKHRNRSKLLTSGRRQQLGNEAAPPSPKETHQQKLPRSPMLPAEIRRSNSSTERETPPPPPQPQPQPYPNPLVARLMGVEKFPVSPEMEYYSNAERRRKLLGALEKCDEDLKALQRIIQVVKTTVAATATGGDNIQIRQGLQQLKHQLKKKPGEEEDIMSACFVHRFAKENARSRSCGNQVETTLSSSWSWRSKAMVQSIDEVCSDIAWGERREVGRIGLTLQDHICRDLIDEFVKEMGSRSTSTTYSYSLPFEACKRGLSF